MFRAALGVVAGLVVIGTCVAVWSILWTLLYWNDDVGVTAMMLTGNLIMGFVGALLGGLLVAWIAPSRRLGPVLVLALLVLVLGAVEAFALDGLIDDPKSMLPKWYNIVMPLVVATGVITGGRLWGRPSVTASIA